MTISSLLQQAGVGLPSPSSATGGNAFAAVSGALQSGNVTAAQQSFRDLKQLLVSAGSIGVANSLKNDFDALGTSLQAARQDLRNLKSDAQAALGGTAKPRGHNLQGLLSTGRTLAGLVM